MIVGTTEKQQEQSSLMMNNRESTFQKQYRRIYKVGQSFFGKLTETLNIQQKNQVPSESSAVEWPHKMNYYPQLDNYNLFRYKYANNQSVGIPKQEEGQRGQSELKRKRQDLNYKPKRRKLDAHQQKDPQLSFINQTKISYTNCKNTNMSKSHEQKAQKLKEQMLNQIPYDFKSEHEEEIQNQKYKNTQLERGPSQTVIDKQELDNQKGLEHILQENINIMGQNQKLKDTYVQVDQSSMQIINSTQEKKSEENKKKESSFVDKPKEDNQLKQEFDFQSYLSQNATLTNSQLESLITPSFNDKDQNIWNIEDQNSKSSIKEKNLFSFQVEKKIRKEKAGFRFSFSPLDEESQNETEEKSQQVVKSFLDIQNQFQCYENKQNLQEQDRCQKGSQSNQTPAQDNSNYLKSSSREELKINNQRLSLSRNKERKSTQQSYKILGGKNKGLQRDHSQFKGGF